MAFHQDYCSYADGSDDENEQRFLENEREFWRLEELRYHIWGDLERYEEARQRNAETTRRMFSIYCSYKIIGILIADAVLSLLLFPRQYFVVGLIGSNFLVFIVLLSCCYYVSKARVRQEIRKWQVAILMPAHDNGLRKS